MRQFRHRNFVEVYDYGVTSNGLAWLVMEYLPGTTLDQLLAGQKGPLPLDLVIKFVREACTALQSAHSRSLVHRDLKPANIMLVEDVEHGERCFKILDFGLSMRLDSEDSLINHTMDRAGTPTYMSPEQVRGDAVTAHSDIYSLGVILFQMLTGHLPIACPNPQAAWFNHVNVQPRHFKEVAGDLPYSAAVEQVIHQCLEKSADRRPKDVAEIQSRLLAELEPRPAPAAARSPWTNGVWIGCGALVALGLAVWLRPQSQTAPQPLVQNNGAQLPPIVQPIDVILNFDASEEIRIPTGGERKVAFEWSGVPEGAELLLKSEPADYVQNLPATLDGQSGRGELNLKVPQSEKSKNADLMIWSSVRQDGTEVAKQAHLLKVRVLWLPAGFTETPGAKVEVVSGNCYASQIERSVGDELVKFVLVCEPRCEGKSFYIMQTKVWRGLFKRFIETAPVPEISPERKAEILAFFGEETALFRRPATNITVDEAFLCSQWLGGELFAFAKANLPTSAQWHRASGFDFYYKKCSFPTQNWDSAKWPEGPYLGKHRQIPVPYDVGTVSDQVSCCGCFDMGSNEAEFLDDVHWFNRDSGPGVPIDRSNLDDDALDLVLVSVRGAASPTFERISERSLLPYDTRNEHTGFRVAISPE
jgi:serine/threonine protein kinase